ncbi:MAG: RNA 2',3'-cyclic phosphodiesterase [Methylotenera sp.]
MSQPIQIKDSNVTRVFFALWPEVSVRRLLYALAEEYQPRCSARIMQIDTLHMTLQFIGNIEHARLPQLIKAADRVQTPPFGLVLEKLSFWEHNRIAYATLNTKVPALDRLVTALRQELTTEDVLFDNSEFNPHVTLLRRVEHIIEPQDIAPIRLWVDAFVLVESVTTSQGTHYRILKKWPLSPTST